MTLLKPAKKSRWLEWLTVFAFVSALSWYFYLRPPSLKGGEITGVTIAIGEVDATVTARPECLNIYKSLRQARPSSEHKCMTAGYITLHYKDGTRDTVGVLPGHDLKRYDLRHNGTCFSLPRQDFFSALNSAGVDTSKLPKLDGEQNEVRHLPPRP